MANPNKKSFDPEVAFRDRQGREQRGRLSEVLGQPDRGVETCGDAMALLMLALAQAPDKPGESE